MIRESPSEDGRGRERGRWATRWLRRLRSLSHRVLHPYRRRAALAATAAHGAPTSVLIVCNGNIFRSPFAAAVLCRALNKGGEGGVAVDSAGFIGPGRPAPPDAVGAAARRGIDLRGHRSRLLTAALVRDADLIVAMEVAQRRILCERFGRTPRDVLLLGDLDPRSVTSRDIEDPWDRGPEVCDAAYARIERCVGELGNALRRAAPD